MSAAVLTRYEDPRAHAVRERYLGIFGGAELPVPVEAIARDLEGRPALFYCRPGDVAAAADRAAEREANVFAAELLMPEPAVRAAWAQEPEVATCAERFAVSGEAMHYRLYNFGLVPTMPVKDEP